MDQSSLKSLLESFESLTILVMGDFFLDRYLMIDPEIVETSIETGLEAHQVNEIRNSPGAAGTVTNNLAALGIGKVVALGAIGDDGHGYDLRRGLEAPGVDTAHLIAHSGRLTPTYTKPINTASSCEMSRLDIKNRNRTPSDIESELINKLSILYAEADGLIVLDQVSESDCGVVTTNVRNRLTKLASDDTKPVLADSRTQIGSFENVIQKPNSAELVSLLDQEMAPNRAALALAQRQNRPVILTRGADGIVVSDGSHVWTIPGIPVTDPIDIVGAGDSVSASVTSALAAGAQLQDAAILGVLVSSITVQQIGTTGTASSSQILDRFASACPDGFAPPAD